MKITEAWDNRTKIIDACKLAGACIAEFDALCEAQTRNEFEAVLLRNFRWCVGNSILDEWLPQALPECKHLYCAGCTGLTSLPELPECKALYCYGCTVLTSLPDLPECEYLNCYGCTGLD